MTLGGYLVGAALFGVIAAAVGVATATFVRRRRPEYAGAERVLAYGVVATAALIASYLLPGALGVLNRWTPALFAILLAAGSRRLTTRRHPAADAPPPARGGSTAEPRESRAELAVAALAVLAAGAGALAHVLEHATEPLVNGDQLQFHLPVVARWIQTASVWGVHDFLPYYGVGNYPYGGDVLSLAAISPWRFDAFVRYAQLPYFVLTGVAVYALARRLDASRPASAVAGAVFVSIPVALQPSVSDALPDAMMIAAFTSGAVFLTRSDHLLAGVAFGLAFGAKWYGVSTVAAVLVLWAIAMLAARRPPRAVARGLTAMGLVVFALGGFWLVRNVVESGTPFFPAGWLPFDAHPSNDVARSLGRGPVDFTIAHYAFDLDVWGDYLLRALYDAFRLAGPLLVVGVAASAVALHADWRGKRLAALPAVALAVTIVLGALYAVTPASAQGPEGVPINADVNARYLLPAAAFAAAVGAWVCGRLGRFAAVAQLAGLVAVVEASRRALLFGWDSFAVAFAVLAAAAALVYVLRAASRRALVAATVVAGLTVVAGGHLLQSRFGQDRYSDIDPAIAWVDGNAASHARVGLAGHWQWSSGAVYPSFGPRLRRDVVYLGPERDGRLVRYGSRAAFLDRLRRTRPDVVVVGLGELAYGEVAATPVIEREWVRAAGWVRVTRSGRLELYRPRPPAKG